jgi:hypothetical protein
MSDNKALWKRAFTTDPKAVKAITGKQYQGNSPRPFWIVERLTDEFGPCGIGWGFSILNERMERLAEGEILHVAVVRLWYVLDGKRGEFEQIGQTRAVYAKKDKSLMIDEDAPKKSVTDALVKCASYLGFAGDIFSGRWDDSKYVAEAGREWRDRERAEAANTADQQPAAQPAAQPAETGPRVAAARIVAGVAAGKAAEAAAVMAGWAQDKRDAVWAHIDAKTQEQMVAVWPKEVAA